MKRKIAVYANGWNRGAMFSAIEGMKKYSAENVDFDIFVFVSHAAYSEHVGVNEGELKIYKVGDVADFDGAIVFSGLLNSDETAAAICRDAVAKNVPVVSIGVEMEGIPFVGMDNEVGMRALVNHLVEQHDAKRVIFIGGTKDHVDSIARLRITRDVLEEHGLELRPCDIYHADWGYDQSIAIADQLVDSGEKLPDVIVCANDYMALAAGGQLVNRGVRVPEEVAVTGFDHTSEGEVFYPSLTTVNQNYEEIGYQCCRIIYDRMGGQDKAAENGGDKEEKKELPRIKIPTRLVLAESCGCLGNRYYEELHRDYCANSYISNTRVGLLGQNERDMQLHYIAPSTDYDSLRRNLQNFYDGNRTFEGNDVSMVLNPLYFKDPLMGEQEVCERMTEVGLEAVVCLDSEVDRANVVVNRNHLIPGYCKEEGKQKVYFFFPLHAEQFNFGYLVYGEDAPILRSRELYEHLERLQENLRSLRINLRLDIVNRKLSQIYDKDSMTGLFNRFGYEDKALPLFQSCKESKSVMMVMFVDINYMKRINDVYGHLHGDNAIRLVAEAIRENLQENWLAVRFGGDEFLIIAPSCDQGTAEQVKQDILDYLERKNWDGTRPYRISASCGYVLTNPNKNLTLQDYIKEADAMMYEIKRQVHARDAKH